MKTKPALYLHSSATITACGCFLVPRKKRHDLTNQTYYRTLFNEYKQEVVIHLAVVEEASAPTARTP